MCWFSKNTLGCEGGGITTNSHYLTYTLFFRKVGRMYFLNLGVEGLRFVRGREGI